MAVAPSTAGRQPAGSSLGDGAHDNAHDGACARQPANLLQHVHHLSHGTSSIGGHLSAWHLLSVGQHWEDGCMGTCSPQHILSQHLWSMGLKGERQLPTPICRSRWMEIHLTQLEALRPLCTAPQLGAHACTWCARVPPALVPPAVPAIFKKISNSTMELASLNRLSPSRSTHSISGAPPGVCMCVQGRCMGSSGWGVTQGGCCEP